MRALSSKTLIAAYKADSHQIRTYLFSGLSRKYIERSANGLVPEKLKDKISSNETSKMRKHQSSCTNVLWNDAEDSESESAVMAAFK